MIKIEHVSHSFDNKPILEDINLEICENEIIGIYGKSGIGKSTLVKILCGLIRQNEGDILFQDQLLSSPKSNYNRQLGLQIQMVYQQPFSVLDPCQKIYKGFEEFVIYHHLCKKKEIKKFIFQIADEVELPRDILNHLPCQISGGEAQRIAIGKCLLLKPKLLILDEATSMLDVSTQANVLGLIRKKVASYNGSILMISHDENLLNYYCQKIYEMKDKQIKGKTKK